MGAVCGRAGAVAEADQAEAVLPSGWSSGEGRGQPIRSTGSRSALLRLPSPLRPTPLSLPLPLATTATSAPLPGTGTRNNKTTLRTALHPIDVSGDGGGGVAGSPRRLQPCGCTSVPPSPATTIAQEELRRSVLGRAMDILPPPLARRWAQLWRPRHLCAGESLFALGQPARAVFLVRSGCVRIAVERAMLPDATAATAASTAATGGLAKMACRRIASTGSLSDDPPSFAATPVVASLLPVQEAGNASAPEAASLSANHRRQLSQQQQQREMRQQQRRTSIGTTLPRSVTEHAEGHLGSGGSGGAANKAECSPHADGLAPALFTLMHKRVGEMLGLESLHALPLDASPSSPPPSEPTRHAAHAVAETSAEVLELPLAEVERFLAEMESFSDAEAEAQSEINFIDAFDKAISTAVPIPAPVGEGGEAVAKFSPRRPRAHRLSAPASFTPTGDDSLFAPSLSPSPRGGARGGGAVEQVEIALLREQRRVLPMAAQRRDASHGSTVADARARTDPDGDPERAEDACVPAEETRAMPEESEATPFTVARSLATATATATATAAPSPSNAALGAPAAAIAIAPSAAGAELARSFLASLRSCSGADHARLLAPYLHLRDCDPALLGLAASLFHAVHLPPGHVLMREGEWGQYLPAGAPPAPAAAAAAAAAGGTTPVSGLGSPTPRPIATTWTEPASPRSFAFAPSGGTGGLARAPTAFGPAVAAAAAGGAGAGAVYTSQARLYFPLQGRLACSIRGNPDATHTRFHKLFDAAATGRQGHCQRGPQHSPKAAPTPAVAVATTTATATTATATATSPALSGVPGTGGTVGGIHRAQASFSTSSSSSSCSLLSVSSGSSMLSTPGMYPLAAPGGGGGSTGMSVTATASASASASVSCSPSVAAALAPSPSLSYSHASVPSSPSPRHGLAPAAANVAVVVSGKAGAHPGFFGDVGALLGVARTATVTAQTRCELLELPPERLRALLLLAPALGSLFAARLQQGHHYQFHLCHLLGCPPVARAFVGWVGRREHSGENYNFWHESRSFRLAFQRHMLSQRNRRAALDILERYILPGADTPVNLAGATVAAVLARWARIVAVQESNGTNANANTNATGNNNNPASHPSTPTSTSIAAAATASESSSSLPGLDADMFLDAEQEVLSLMNSDSFPRFRASEAMGRVVAEAVQAVLDGTAAPATGAGAPASGAGAGAGGATPSAPSTPSGNSARRNRQHGMPATKRAQSSVSLGQFDARMVMLQQPLQPQQQRGAQGQGQNASGWLGSPSRSLRPQQPLSSSPLTRSPAAAFNNSPSSSARHRHSQSVGVVGWASLAPLSRQLSGSPGTTAALLAHERSPRTPRALAASMSTSTSASTAAATGTGGFVLLQRGVSLGGTVSSVPEVPDRDAYTEDGGGETWERDDIDSATPVSAQCNLEPPGLIFADVADDPDAATALGQTKRAAEQSAATTTTWLATGGAASLGQQQREQQQQQQKTAFTHGNGLESLRLPSAPLSALLMADTEA